MQNFFDYHTHDYTRQNAFISVKAEVLQKDILCPIGSKFFLEFHPWDLPQFFSPIDESFLILAQSEMVYGIGEIGLDKLKINKTPFDVQLAYFEKLISLASTLKKPVMLHIVRAWNEAKKILAEYPIPAIYFHGFYGKIEFLKELLATGINVSLNPKMLEREELYNFLRKNPNYIEKIKLETDDKNLDIKNLYSKLYEGIKNDR